MWQPLGANNSMYCCFRELWYSRTYLEVTMLIISQKMSSSNSCSDSVVHSVPQHHGPISSYLQRCNCCHFIVWHFTNLLSNFLPDYDSIFRKLMIQFTHIYGQQEHKISEQNFPIFSWFRHYDLEKRWTKFLTMWFAAKKKTVVQNTL